MTGKQIFLNLFFCLVVSSSIVFSLAVLKSHQVLGAEIEAERQLYKDEVPSLYLLLSQQGSHTKTIMNMVMRNYHYIHPENHTGEFHRPSGLCPECADLYQRKGEPSKTVEDEFDKS